MTSPAVTVGLVVRMLREGFDGAPGPWTYFTDTSMGSGVLSTIDALTAAQASHAGGPGLTTIAGHVHHLEASVTLTTRTLRGESASRDRSRSWTVSAVDDAAWAALPSGTLWLVGHRALRNVPRVNAVWELLLEGFAQAGE